ELEPGRRGLVPEAVHPDASRFWLAGIDMPVHTGADCPCLDAGFGEIADQRAGCLLLVPHGVPGLYTAEFRPAWSRGTAAGSTPDRWPALQASACSRSWVIETRSASTSSPRCRAG